MVEIPTWTSIWKTIPKRDKNGGVGGIGSFDFTTDPNVDGYYWDLNKASFWLGSMGDFQVKGFYLIRVYPSPDNPDVTWADIRPELDWRWVDRIDANSWLEYNWEKNDKYTGVIEGLFGDLIGDKLLGASFDINVIF